MRTLVIARHGNTFHPGETPTRVGARTDLPLTEEERARGIGRYLLGRGIKPTRILAAPLLRTRRTAELAAQELGIAPGSVQIDSRFVEIDYGPDENKTEREVALRLGRVAAAAAGQENEAFSLDHLEALGTQVIELWNARAVVPEGWNVDPQALMGMWQQVASEIAEDEILLCVSSNGIIRFAPVITGDYDAFCAVHDIKVPTGGVCIFTSEDHAPWLCDVWGVKAFKIFSKQQ